MNSLMLYAMNIMADIEAGKDEWKVRIRQQWKDSIKMPRKMKKKVRKSLILDWSLANYDPFKME